MKKIFPNIKTWKLFVLLSLGHVLISVLFQNFVMTKDVYYNLLSGQLESSRLNMYIDAMNRIHMWTYFFIPLAIWIKLLFITFILQLPFMLKLIEFRFGDLFRTVVLAGFVLMGSSAYRLLWLYFQPVQNIDEETLAFVPLSLTAYLRVADYNPAVYSFLSLFNVFELAWMLVIYKGIISLKKAEKIDAALIVFCIWAGLALVQLLISIYLRNM